MCHLSCQLSRYDGDGLVTEARGRCSLGLQAPRGQGLPDPARRAEGKPIYHHMYVCIPDLVCMYVSFDINHSVMCFADCVIIIYLGHMFQNHADAWSRTLNYIQGYEMQYIAMLRNS